MRQLSWHGNRMVNEERGQPFRKERSMKPRRRFARLSNSELEFLEMVLLEEMERQVWFAVAFSDFFDAELLITLQ